ncbi:MAG TPA: branched-chain amino acid ABC transporter permease [Pseudolabrys sp.]|nr:branched-chain amino acid ABC transporter permease [Pseudolabrys sp.]
MSASVSQEVARAAASHPRHVAGEEIVRHLRRPFFWLVVVFTLACGLTPYLTDDVSLRENLLLAAVYVTLATNLNLMIGYAGYVNFGNIVFFGLGGYIGVYLATTWHVYLPVAALVGGICVSALAYLFGRGILRLRGAFFALATIGVNEAISAFVTNFEPWGAATGIYLSMDAYEPLGGPMAGLWFCYFLIVGVMGLSLLLSYFIKTSKFGLGLMAIGQNEDAAAVLGVATPRYKAIVYSISGFLPAVAGGLYFFKSGIIEPAGAFDLTASIETIVMLMLGGAGTVTGPVIGAFLYEELRGYLLFSETFSHLQLVLAGVLLLVIVLFVPGGLMGWLFARAPWLRKWLQ